MDLLEGLATTRSIRRYTDEPVTDDEIRTIMWAATRAPSGSNRQPFRFIAVRGPSPVRALLTEAAQEMWGMKRADDGYDSGSGADASSPKARMARTMAAYAENIGDAPAIVFACLARYRRPDPFEGASVYPACQNLLLAARAIGLGGVLTQIQMFREPAIREALGVPDGVALHATITLGHPVGHHGPVRRRPLGELVFAERWDGDAAWAVDPPGTRFTSAGPPR
jgi:nitroreductase